MHSKCILCIDVLYRHGNHLYHEHKHHGNSFSPIVLKNIKYKHNITTISTLGLRIYQYIVK